MTLLDLVYEYRSLLAKTRSGNGLSWDEIDIMGKVEGMFSKPDSDAREFSRKTVSLEGTLRTQGVREPAHIIELSPGGLVCEKAPHFNVGDKVEIVLERPITAEEIGARDAREVMTRAETVEEDADASPSFRSYRFTAVVTWIQESEQADENRVGFSFLGVPVIVVYGDASGQVKMNLRAA